MKKLTVIFLVAFVSIVWCNSLAVGQAQPEDAINTIRRQYSAINKRAARYKKAQKELSGFSLEGGQLVAYLDGPAIVKLVLNHYGEMGSTLEEYYYSNGKLIFVYEKIFHYNKPMSGKVVRTVENRYYFNNDQLIRWMDEKRNQVSRSDADYQSKQKELIDASNRFLAGAQSKSPTIEAPNP